MLTTAHGQRLSWLQIAAYGGLALPVATIGLPLSIYLAPFYAGDLGLPIAAIGLAMLIGRFSDIITDPLIGLLSDRWVTRFGRRRVWLLIGVPMLALSTWMLFHPLVPELWYFLLWLSLTYLSFTVLQLPYMAWGGELSFNYEERSRITSARQMFSIVGLVASTALPAAVMAKAGNGTADVLHVLAVLMLVLLPMAGLLAFLLVPEPPVPAAAVARHAGMFSRKTLRQLWRNAPYRLMVFVLLIGYTAETFRITITLFFARDVIGLSDVGLVYVYYFIAGFLLTPFWTWFGNRIGKHRALAIAFMIVILTTVAIFALERGQTTLFTILFVAKGMCFGALEMLANSMIGDTADVDTVLSRTRRQGQLFAIMLVVIKFGQALGQFLSLNLLALAGYSASSGNTPDAIFWLRVLYCIAPPAMLIFLLPMLWRYPLTAQRHRRFQKFVETRF